MGKINHTQETLKFSWKKKKNLLHCQISNKIKYWVWLTLWTFQEGSFVHAACATQTEGVVVVEDVAPPQYDTVLKKHLYNYT